MKKRTPVSRIMTSNVVSLNKTDSLEEAEALFKRHNIRHIPITQGQQVIGILSHTDLLRISFADSIGYDDQDVETTVYNMFTIEQVMVKKLETVSSTTTVREVAEILSKREFHALPVVDNNVLVGIVTSTDLINFLLDQF